MKRAKVFINSTLAGILTEDDMGYEFRYDADYIGSGEAEAISLTLPLKEDAYRDNVLFPFFDGLIPEGWLLDITEQSWKISDLDRFSLLLVCCMDCIGNISIISEIVKEVVNE